MPIKDRGFTVDRGSVKGVAGPAVATCEALNSQVSVELEGMSAVRVLGRRYLP